MKLHKYLHIFLIGLSIFAFTAHAQETTEEPNQESESDFLDGLEEADGEWIVVSQHYKHTENCIKLGCILSGPVADQDACKAWAKEYNKKDPFDHARCVDGTGYLDEDQ